MAEKETDKIEIDNVGSALAKQFSQLDEDQQAQVLSNIGLVQEKTSPKDAFKSLSDVTVSLGTVPLESPN